MTDSTPPDDPTSESNGRSSAVDPHGFEQHRPLIFGIAYRMTGSISDAEELVQQSWIRRRAARGPVEDERALLTTIVTRLSIDHLRSARRRRERYVGSWLPEPLVTDPDDPATTVERRDLLALGVLTLMETLSPPQRAVLILRDAFGYPHREIAAILDLSPDATRQHYSRARQRLAEGKERFEPSRERQRELLERFAVAAAGGGTHPLEELLAEEVTVWADGGGQVPAARHPVVGREKVARLIRGLLGVAPAGLEFRVAHVNTEPGLLVIDDGVVDGVYAFTWTDSGALHSIHAVRNPDKLRRGSPDAATSSLSHLMGPSRRRG